MKKRKKKNEKKEKFSPKLAKKLKQHMETEARTKGILKKQEEEIEEEAKKIISWLLAEREKGNSRIIMLEVTDKEWKGVLSNTDSEDGKYESKKDLTIMMEALEYIAEHVCDETTFIRKIQIKPSRKSGVEEEVSVFCKY